MWSVVYVWEYASGESRAGTGFGFTVGVNVHFEATSSATEGAVLETVWDRIASVPALVSFEVLSCVGDGGDTGVRAAGAMMNTEIYVVRGKGRHRLQQFVERWEEL